VLCLANIGVLAKDRFWLLGMTLPGRERHPDAAPASCRSPVTADLVSNQPPSVRFDG